MERTKVVAQAIAWIGLNEADGSHKKIIDIYNTIRPLPRGYIMRYTDSWCSAFISAVAEAAGARDIIPAECSCNQQIALFKTMGCWQENDAYIPMPGDLIFYDWQDSGAGDNTGGSDHVGIVEKVADGIITAIEGNYSNSVKRRYIQVDSRYIRGYGVPRYEDPVEPAVDPEKSIDQLAREVLAGKWGNGAERKNLLEAAGYDYTAVQRRVNEIVGGSKTGKTVDQLAHEVLQGKWGNGAERKKKLQAAGYDYNEVQHRVNELLK